MKNKLNKFITSSLLAILLMGGLASAQKDVATPVSDQVENYSSASSWNGYGNDRGMMDTGSDWQSMKDKRFSNEKEMWRDMMPAFAAGFVGLGIVFSLIGLLFLAFWIWMLVHAASKDIKHKPLWILVIWFMHIVGAIIYFFAVKRRYDAEMKEECACDTCLCEEDLEENTCACGQHETCICNEHEEHTHKEK